MPANINYWWVALIALGAVALITWLIKRDQRDKKTLEKEIIKSELKPEKHNEPQDKEVSP